MARDFVSRREFLCKAVKFGALFGGAALVLSREDLLVRLFGHPARAWAEEPLAELIRQAPRARYWISPATAMGTADCLSCHPSAELQGRTTHAHRAPATVKCLLCAHTCLIPAGERGRCRARMNVAGELRSLVYGRPIAIHVDPIEKKPFYHFLPGSQAFSLATAGCPLRCKFCQNWEISQALPEDHISAVVPPGAIVASTLERGAPVIAFTYNEPTVFTEYLTDIARAGREKGLRSVLVSCGFMNEAPLAEMCQVLAAIKIDLKGLDEGFYRTVSGAELQPVLRSIRQVAKSGVHLELVNLVVPTLNDSEKMLTELSRWVVGELGPDVPVHFTRFHPDYQLRNLSPTPVATLERARNIALARGMHYPYVGNVPGHPGNHTYCPGCGRIVIERDGFFVTKMEITGGQCRFCHTKIAGVWS
jgi:pyruvate formate lyase activating enzyme